MSIVLLGFRHVAQLAEALIVYVNAEKIKKSEALKKYCKVLKSMI